MPDVLSPLPGKLLLTPGSGTIRGDPELLDSYFPIRSSRVESDAEGHGVRSPLRRPITPSPVSPLSHDPRAAGDRPSKVIKKVYVRIERHVYDVKIAYDGGSETSWRSSNTGQQLEFELAEGEYITHVWYAADNDSIQGVLFGTSTGRKSGWLGFEYGLYGLLVKDGCILGSLSGIIQDGRLSTLTPEWLPYRLGGEIRWYQTRHATLEAEWTEYRSAVAELEQQISGGRISWDQLGTYTIAVTDALAELVQDVEILRGMEQESSTALVKVTALREEYLTSHLRVCRQASEAIRTQLSLLANVLGPLSGQLGPSVESIRERGAKLLSLLVKLREDVQVYIQSLGQVVVNLGNELDIWKLQADSARLAFAEDKEKFNKVMAPKGITVTETNDQEASLWGLQDWYHRIPPELIENTAESHILVEVTKSDARMQYAISQITFLQRNKKQLSAHKSQVETLQRQIDVTVSSLRDVIRTVQSLHPDGGAISQGGSNLAALVKSLVALVEQLLVATRSREFGTILVSILQSILSDTGFEFREDGRLLLRASKAIIS
ncbi:uncharacterized protein PHACADRAFT_128479 [Phanerochaete carnosa HHB-10118-sp]|uniref:Jacalin-type lectin domain-containing protein n=1 Tax=Phanerochaete carnosa (strain HHB-10118-sp) TaxID=650164 RepID=K5UMG1_PHACS|nr:uncharacterized protein PHACADRAFT_128479 [Phanerochaete carnosa HHB-10118-sp]EKM50871.1 hypothetical protein PHACADRAFT_128479 [Phanerochaete carnosa HHB-10118-sp]